MHRLIKDQVITRHLTLPCPDWLWEMLAPMAQHESAAVETLALAYVMNSAAAADAADKAAGNLVHVDFRSAAHEIAH